ncbi:MAG: DUF1045 domain-containing protein [Pseudomonadota bacterium]
MTRYAIYFVPVEDIDLWQFGSAAVGYDSMAATAVPFHKAAFYKRPEIADWTADPRRYGFHATLKPPFALADGTSIEGLEAAAAEFCTQRRRFSVERLDVTAIGGFLALVPAAPSSQLNRLAADCVTAFEAFRAPLSEADLARRLKSPLSDNQRAHLEKWGYPYVFDEFRFHMTLTGRLPEAVRTQALETLRELYAPIAGPVHINAVSICEQPSRDANFNVRRSFTFGG